MAHSYPFVYLRDSQPLNPFEFERIKEVLQSFREILSQRMQYIKAANLEPEVHVPTGFWGKFDSDIAAFQALPPCHRVLQAEYAHINNIRMYLEHITGWAQWNQSYGSECSGLDWVLEGYDQKLEMVAQKEDQWVKRYLDAMQVLPRELLISPPRRFGEIGWEINGKVINHDTFVYMERLSLMYHAGLIDWLRQGKGAQGRPARVMEIGSGYGALAYFMKRMVPETRYILIDIPDTLIFAAIYLLTLYPNEANVLCLSPEDAFKNLDKPGFTFVPNYFFPKLVERLDGLDLGINTLSMSEMNEPAVRMYASGLSKLVGNTGAFFEQNQDNSPVGLINACDHIRGNFRYEYLLDKAPLDILTQGASHLWSNYDIRS